MTQIGNVIEFNEQYAAPQVGQGATVLHWTDRSAWTVTKVSPSGKTIELQRDKVKEWEPWPAGRAKELERDPNGEKMTARLGKKGWKSGGEKVLVGPRDEYRDPSF